MEPYGDFGGLLEGLWHALRSLVEGLDGLFEFPWEFLVGLDGSEGVLVVIWDSS